MAPITKLGTKNLEPGGWQLFGRISTTAARRKMRTLLQQLNLFTVVSSLTPGLVNKLLSIFHSLHCAQ